MLSTVGLKGMGQEWSDIYLLILLYDALASTIRTVTADRDRYRDASKRIGDRGCEHRKNAAGECSCNSCIARAAAPPVTDAGREEEEYETSYSPCIDCGDKNSPTFIGDDGPFCLRCFGIRLKVPAWRELIELRTLTADRDRYRDALREMQSGMTIINNDVARMLPAEQRGVVEYVHEQAKTLIDIARTALEGAQE
jgi:hypothetical protein